MLYVEAHGTGTVAGDFEELTAIAKVFTNPQRHTHTPLYVGSIKGNIGHTENTSGLASLVKAALILDRLQIPPTAGLANLKPGLPLEHIHIPTELLAWPQLEEEKRRNNAPPRVSINSFGFGGTNAHAILEKAPPPPPCTAATTGRPVPHLFIFSASSKASLAKLVAAYHSWIQLQDEDVDLASLSYTLCHRRSRLSWRYSCVASDHKSLRTRLHEAMVGVNASPAVSSARDHPGLVFVFTGQGAQWVGMGRELISSSETFRASIRASRAILLELGATWDLEAELVRSWDAEGPAGRLSTAELAQPMTTAVQVALVELLRSFGLLLRGGPCAVVGHSSGEIAAAYAAGYLSAQQAVGIAYHRGFMAGAVKLRGLPPGAMLSVGLGENEALPFTKGLSRGTATIACVNSPKSVTVSGDAEAVDEISARLAGQEEEGVTIFHRRLLVDTAYHSYHMHAVAEEYRRRLETLGLDEEQTCCTSGGPDGIAFFSSVTGMPKTSGFGVEYWTTNLVSPVRFHDAMRTLADNTDNHYRDQRSVSFVEVGPHSSLGGPVRQCFANREGRAGSLSLTGYHSVLQRKADAISTTLALVGHLFELGVEVDFDAVPVLSSLPSTGKVLSNLPSYPCNYLRPVLSCPVLSKLKKSS